MNTAPVKMAIVQELLEESLATAGQIHETHRVEMFGVEFLVSRRDNGTWVLSDDSVLRWFDGEDWIGSGEADFSAQIDATTPRHIAAAAHNIITAPADQRAYVAAVEGPNVAPAEAPAENGLIVASARNRGSDRGHTAAAAGGDRDALAEETATNLYPDVPQLRSECADAFRLAWDARLSQ